MIDSLKDLRTSAWRTAGNRYNAARRLRRRENFATVSLALMSALTVAIAFTQRVYALPTSPADNYLSTISVALGILLLTVSLVEWGAKTGAEAEALHQNAEKLTGFQRKVLVQINAGNAGAPLNWADVHALNADYDAIKADCRYNHSPLDDQYFRLHHLFEPAFLNGGQGPAMSQAQVIRVWIKWQLASIWYIAAIWIFLAALLVPLFFSSMWEKARTEAVKTQPTQCAKPDKNCSSS